MEPTPTAQKKPVSDVLYMHVIYARPKDHPEHFVVRRWAVTPGKPEPVPDQECHLTISLHLARAFVPRGLFCLPRDKNDDPAIVEVWL